MADKLIGFGSTAKGTAIHAVLGLRIGIKNNYSLCDKRMKEMIVGKALTKEEVTCPKCLKHSLLTGKTKPQKKVPAPKKKVEPKAAPAAKKKTKREILAETMGKEIAGKKKTTPAKEKVVKPKKLKALKEFELKQMLNETFSIKHTPSGQLFFKNLSQELSIHLLELLNKMTIGWDGKNSVNKEFISEALSLFKKAHTDLKLALPQKFQEREEKHDAIDKIKEAKEEAAGKKITRRGEKKSKTVKTQIKISRRKKKFLPRSTADALPRPITRRHTTPTKLVRALVKDGSTLREMLTALSREFGFAEKRSRSKFKAILRKITRVQGRSVVHTIFKNHLDDSYTFRIEK